MRKFNKSTLALAASAAVVAGVSMAPSLSLAWGDNGGGRRSYTINQINSGILGNKITFNSISDSVIGDEKNFVGARENTGINAGANNVWNGNDITVEDGKEYLVRLYVHNNSPLGMGAISENTRVAFNIPTESSRQVQVNGFIFSDNATPSEYWDYVNFNSDHAFHLEYVYGSALLENNGIGAGGGIQLSDKIVTKAASENGVQIGYDKLDGRVPGCYEYASYVSIKVKVVYDNDYTITQKIRLAGTSGWTNGSNVEAKVGDKVEIQATYTNTNTNGETQNNVMVKTILPDNLRYVPGSTKLYNGNHPNGATVNQDTIVTTGINIGHYEPKANAYIRFTAEVVDNSLECGSNTLVDWTQAGVSQKTLQDYATVVVNKPCTKPTEQEYNVKINYIYAETGEEAATTYVEKFQTGDSFSVKSPLISGYTADTAVVSGTMGNQDLTYTVKYTQNPQEYNVRIHYIYEDGRIAAPTYNETYEAGSSFSVKSPEIAGYTADYSTVSGEVVDQDVDWTVTYVANPAENPEDPTTPVEPDQPTTPDVKLPTTGGVSSVAGNLLAIGAVATSAGYYVASRKGLRA